MQNPEVLVSISCITYNHASFIRHCLDGFLMQKTDFAFEVLIHDDASTDETAEIIKEYESKFPDIIKPIYETENQWVKGRKGSACFNFPRAQGKYIAMCEGDDYWTDPNKLQKQVDFLESHDAYGLVYTRSAVYSQDNRSFEDFYLGMSATSFDDLVRSNVIPTLTVCFRKSLLSSYYRDVKVSSSWKMGDYPLWLYFALKSRIHFMDEVTAVYRNMTYSASHFSTIEEQIKFYESSSEICLFFINMANRSDLYSVYKKKYFDLIVTAYISYGLPTPHRAVKKYWIWNPKSVIRYLCSQSEILRRVLR